MFVDIIKVFFLYLLATDND